METRRALLFVSSLWELARFFLIVSLLAIVFRAATLESVAIMPWLLVVGSGNLLLPVLGLLLFLYPERYGNLIGLLRLGKGLGVFAFILLALSSGSVASGASSAFSVVAGSVIIRVGGLPVTRAAMMFGIFAVDLAFLGALMFYPSEGSSGKSRNPETPDGKGTVW